MMKTKIVSTAFILLLLSTLAFASNQQSISEERQVSSNEKITLDVQRGAVQIRPASGNQFKVSGKLDEKAEGFELESAGGFTQFKVKMPRQLNERGNDKAAGSDLVIEVPVGSNVEFKGVNVDVSATGIQGGSQLTTVNGDIKARQLSTSVELTTVNGKIESEALQGQLRLKTVNGKIDDKGASGRMSVESVNGKIELDSRPTELQLSVVNGEIDAELDGTAQITVSSVNGNVELELKNQIAPRIKGSSVSGKFELKLPANLDARVSMKTSAGGSIKNTLTADQPIRAKYGPASSLQFSTGKGSGDIEISTVSGRLELKKE